jgi:hypothetical protein
MNIVYQSERSNNGRGTIQSGGTTKSTKETTRKGKERRGISNGVNIT